MKNMLLNNSGEKEGLARDKSSEEEDWANPPKIFQMNKNSVPADNMHT